MLKSRKRLFRFLIFIVLGIVLAGCSGKQTQQRETGQIQQAKWPEKDIVIIVPYKAGGGYDIKARAVAPLIEKYLPNKVNVIVKNVPGAEAKVGTLEMANSKPDGYTLALVDPIQLGTMQKQGGFESLDPKTFTYLGQLDAAPSLMVIRTKGRFEGFDDMRGQNVSFGMLGTNTLVNIAVANALGAKPTLIPYDSTPEGCLAVARGDLDVWIATAYTVYKQVQTLEGKLKPLLLIGGRTPQFPDTLKTAKEAGLELDETTGLCRVIIAGPPNLDQQAKKVLSEAIDKATHDPEFAEQLKKAGYIAAPLTGTELQKAVDQVFTLVDKYQQWIPKKK
ncbi:MAG: tripartite tricarboxylate transporter substrate binding protein [Bacillota bacterium]